MCLNNPKEGRKEQTGTKISENKHKTNNDIFKPKQISNYIKIV